MPTLLHAPDLQDDAVLPAPRPRSRRRYGIHYLLLAPALVLSLSIVLVPGVFTFLTSFTSWNGVESNPEVVGFGNYLAIFGDPVFLTALKNNIIWTLLFLTVPVALGLGAAVLLLRRPRSRGVFQVIFLLPYVMAAVTNAMVWLNMIYSPITGIVGVLNKQGLDVTSPLASMDTAIFAVAAVDMWHYWGFLLVVYLAALRQTPQEQVEAAQIEGAGAWQVFRYVYLPNIRPTMQLMFVMIMIFSFLTFDYIFLMTQGGPAHSTEMLSTFAYSFAFATFQFGKAAAVGIVMSLFGLVASILYTRMSGKASDS